MANRRDLASLIVVAVLAVLVSAVGLVLGFHSNRLAPQIAAPPPIPDRGPIVYGMRSMVSEPDRVRFEWNEVGDASGYRITVLSATDDSLFTSPVVATTSWTIPPDLRKRLHPQTTYHWRLTVEHAQRPPQLSEIASFATQ